VNPWDEWLAKRLADSIVVGWVIFTLIAIARNQGWL
jgi:hypothetical protein